MSIPLDRLYHYIESIAKKVHGDVVISRFWPHGSKKLEHLVPLGPSNWVRESITPAVICHDQEPLDYDLYETVPTLDPFIQKIREHDCYTHQNLKRYNIFDKDILLHSELNSPQVAKYQKLRYLPVYYWSHALISLDWFRFAQHVDQKKQVTKTFLIYNRAWSGTREYRAKFAECLIDHQLLAHCRTKFNCVDPESNLHYKDYVFSNPCWCPQRDLSDFFESNQVSSASSADFDLHDYESTQIEVVLETLFDDSRNHGTEKMLRPIACGQPFILTATPNSLQYLKNYGFKTFHDVWDESYDLITDSRKRLEAIINVMKTIANWSAEEKQKKFLLAQEIAQYNKNYFFSQDFYNLIVAELETNLAQALQELCATNTCSMYLERRKQLSKNSEVRRMITGKSNQLFSSADVMQVLMHVRKYYDQYCDL